MLRRVVRERERELRVLGDRLADEAAADLAKKGRSPTLAEVDNAISRAHDRYAVTEDRIVRELAAIAFSNIGDFVEPDGTIVRDFSRVPVQQMAAVQELIVTHTLDVDGADDSGPHVTRNVKVKLFDKRGALMALGSYVGLSMGELRDASNGRVGFLPSGERAPAEITEVEYTVVDPKEEDDDNNP